VALPQNVCEFETSAIGPLLVTVIVAPLTDVPCVMDVGIPDSLSVALRKLPCVTKLPIILTLNTSGVEAALPVPGQLFS
jgi:hypothetical protein